MLTKIGMESVLKRIWETGGLTPDMENDLKKLKDDFAEREGMLRKYGEEWDEESEEYEYKEKQGVEGDGNDWKLKYAELKQRYIDRFFGGVEPDGDSYAKTMEEVEEDVKRDGRPQTFDELLEKTEG